MAILEAKGLGKYYGRRKVVDGVNFQVDVGEVVGLLGANGAGKTTSFRMTTGQIIPNEGRVIFDGKDVTQLPMFRRARLGMGYLAQETSVFRKLTVEQNILAVLEVMPAYRSLKRRLSRAERFQKTDEMLTKFGLSQLRKNNAARLSGGEKRRLEIARCLVCDPLLILLDEPFTGIDPPTIEDIQKIVRDLRDQGIGILITDHRVREVLSITDRSYLIHQGKVLTHGTPKQLINDPITKVYFGNQFEADVLSGAVRLGGAGFGPAPDAGLAMSAGAAVPDESIHRLVEQEKVRRLIDRLRTSDYAAAAAELAQRGPGVLPLLLETLERRDVEMRHRAFEVLQRLLGDEVDFDPFAPEAQRKQQLAMLRSQLERKAG